MFKWLFGGSDDDKVKLLDETFFDIKKDGNQIYVSLNNKENLLDLNKIIIVKFGNDGCPNCKMFRGPLKSFEKANSDNVETYEIDTTLSPNLSQQLGIRSIPSNLIFFKGELYNIVIGANLEGIAQTVHKLGFPVR